VDVSHLAKKIFIAVIAVLAVLVCIPMAYREIWRWRTQQQRALLLQKHAFDPMDVIYIASRPYTSTAGIKAASRFKSTKRQILTRWAVAYATSVPALFVLILGLAGLFSCLCQYILLKSVEKQVPALSSEVGDFAGTVVNALSNASEQWAVSANSVIESTNQDINDKVFGWVQNGTSAINNTLNTFMTEIDKAINATFGGTILLEPVQGTIKCLLGLKVDSVEKGLTWVHDHAHVTFPEFKKDTFSLGAAASLTNTSSDDSFLASPGSVAADDITNAIQKMINIMSDALRQETIISSALVALWLLIVLIGVICAAFSMLGRDKTRAEGGALGYTGENRNPMSPRSPNLRNNDGGFVGAFGEKPRHSDEANVVGGSSGKFPAFGSSTSEIQADHDTGHDAWAAGALNNQERFPEKVKQVSGTGRKGVIERRGHERESSYGYVGDVKR
jgi:hypothetical protein